ncbi:thiolase family protein [Ligilactobacillus hohenheimensis]|uniref:thiolase family protein n=1 Tax=Ligilactobacillus hohenheimensis TaxID=2991832 RepID=UPI0024BB39AC|nr:thiolase family protein [Ligilactobacillus hohenheimensis]
MKVKIIAARRTPVGKVNGMLRQVAPEELYRQLIQGQREKGIPTTPDMVVLGNAVNQGGNLARRCALAAGISSATPAMTVDCQCAGGLQAVVTGARMIETGDAALVFAGGVESSSQAYQVKTVTGAALMRFPLAPMGMRDLDPGSVADRLAVRAGITRSQADRYAVRSQQRTCQARESGITATEIIPVNGIKQDECPRPATTLEGLSRLKPVFHLAGVCTAGNSCPINDGASSVVLAAPTSDYSAQGYLLGSTLVGGRSDRFLETPVLAVRTLLAKMHLSSAAISAYEVNEPFAVAALFCQRHLGVPAVRWNPYGGALASGHPYGATGGILIARLLNYLNRLKRPAVGVAAMCIAGGMGSAVLVGNRQSEGWLAEW